MASTQHIAATAVLDTVELCEIILKNLDFYDLLHARNVNHFFRQVIAGSKPLQRNLFLLQDKDQEHTPNPLLLDRLLKICDITDITHHRGNHVLQLDVNDTYEVNRLSHRHGTNMPTLFANMLTFQGQHYEIEIRCWLVFSHQAHTLAGIHEVLRRVNSYIRQQFETRCRDQQMRDHESSIRRMLEYIHSLVGCTLCTGDRANERPQILPTQYLNC